MKFENSFVVDAPVDDVWSALMDVARVAPCMPGAEVLEQVGDDEYKVGIKVKVGPISMRYRGQVAIAERDDDQRRATMHAKARETRGQGTADANVHLAVVEEGTGAHATMETEVQLRGRVAAMGAGVIGDVAEALVGEFATNLAAMLAPAPVAASNGAASAAAAAPGGEPPFAVSEPAPSARHEAPPPPSAERSLPLGKVAATVVAGRLSDPRTLVAATLGFGAVCVAIGYVLGRAR